MYFKTSELKTAIIKTTKKIFVFIFGSLVETEVAVFFVFLHVRMMGYFRLGKG